MKSNSYIKTILITAIISLTSCEDFLEVETPNHKIVSESVFNNDQTALSAMTGIYNELFLATFTGGGRETSVSILAGLSADELKTLRANDLNLIEFEENEIQPNNSRNLSIWTSAYNIIYMTNSLLEGVSKSTTISEEVRLMLEGEASFIRAFTYFTLLNIYGEVPLILSTDYRENALSTQATQADIYDQILADLNVSITSLSAEYRDNDRTRVNRFAAIAMSARVHLYLENWEEAERMSSQVIQNNSTYSISQDLNTVFLANSQEALWQISPIGGSGILSYTNEGSTLIFHPSYPALTKVALKDSLVNSFDEQDKRLENWIALHEETGNYYAYKYKDRSSINNISEYSMVLRLAEQFLIRAEARMQQGNLSAAKEDLDVIRERAGLNPIALMEPSINEEDLLTLILEERQKELFTEWGHRWTDLKRTGRIQNVLDSKPSEWSDTDWLYPIPAQERMKNPNLNQNQGY